MQENVPLTIERLSDTHEGECRVTSMRQILSFLRSIAESGAPVALYFDGARDFIMTSVLDIGEKGLWVEQSTDMPKNRRITESRKMTLVSSLDHVKIQFSANAARAVTHRSYPAFYLPLPGMVYRVQRREYYRLMLPLSEHMCCVISAGEPPELRQVEVPVMDISGGGVRLSYAEKEIEFVMGQTYAGCRINLPEVGRIEVTITVRNLVSVSPKPGQIIRRAGCEFRDLDNASSMLLQRYVTKMQRLKADA